MLLFVFSAVTLQCLDAAGRRQEWHLLKLIVAVVAAAVSLSVVLLLLLLLL